MVSERMAPTRYVLAAISQDATTNKQLVIDLAKSASLTVKVTREMSLSADQKTELHKRNPALAKVFDCPPVSVLLLESQDAVQQWLNVKQELAKDLNQDDFYSSSSEASAKSDLLWYKSVVQKKRTATTGNGMTKSSSGAAATPKQRMATMTSNARSSAATATTRRRSAASSQDAGTSKGPKSDTMGSNRTSRNTSVPSRVPIKTSSDGSNSNRVAKRSPASMATKKNNVATRKTKPAAASPSTLKESDQDETSAQVSTTSTEMEKEQQQLDTPNVEPNHVEEIYPSTTTNGTREENESEHDAEVAATTRLANVASSASVATTATTMTNTTMTTDDRSSTSPSILRTSLSPNSISSLPRPETPEVDHLRQRFESIAQITSPTNKPYGARPSTTSPDNPLKVKDMKPKSPSGARVKSMVDFFMDENLHKWEF
ncbi:hypothetical protein LRAMOSA11341 [Lichtheimia ramosa]|uniref:Nucleoside diphosphate kinase n=1 Tax=Lichtheimia ramosa TaxID=688394 RepID=A0A077WU48_9FUNG|nr:hypothetical protein LRAMOSA11341 [Lichtheimia ramosa]